MKDRFQSKQTKNQLVQRDTVNGIQTAGDSVGQTAQFLHHVDWHRRKEERNGGTYSLKEIKTRISQLHYMDLI